MRLFVVYCLHGFWDDCFCRRRCHGCRACPADFCALQASRAAGHERPAHTERRARQYGFCALSFVRHAARKARQSCVPDFPSYGYARPTHGHHGLPALLSCAGERHTAHVSGLPPRRSVGRLSCRPAVQSCGQQKTCHRHRLFGRGEKVAAHKKSAPRRVRFCHRVERLTSGAGSARSVTAGLPVRSSPFPPGSRPGSW